jgi:hypothetical protein
MASLIQPFIILNVHPHGKEEGLKRADKEKTEGKHRQRRYAFSGKEDNVRDFKCVGNCDDAEQKGKMIQQEKRVKIFQEILDPQPLEE